MHQDIKSVIQPVGTMVDIADALNKALNPRDEHEVLDRAVLLSALVREAWANPDLSHAIRLLLSFAPYAPEDRRFFRMLEEFFSFWYPDTTEALEQGIDAFLDVARRIFASQPHVLRLEPVVRLLTDYEVVGDDTVVQKFPFDVISLITRYFVVPNTNVLLSLYFQFVGRLAPTFDMKSRLPVFAVPDYLKPYLAQAREVAMRCIPDRFNRLNWELMGYRASELVEAMKAFGYEIPQEVK